MPKKTMPEPEEIARVDFETLQQQLVDALAGSLAIMTAVGEITVHLRAARQSSSIGEQWARMWGELLSKKAAAKMLGVSVNTLVKIVGDGGIKAAPDGRILVRSAAEWANQPQKVNRKQEFRV